MTDGICPFAEFVPGVTTFSRGHVDRVGFADHTAGGFLSTMRNPGFWNGAGVSTHFAIGRKGQVVQLVNIFDTAFAQGRLGPRVSWPPYQAMNHQNPNGYLISTEHEDAETVNGRTVFVPGAAWTPEQYAADLRVKQWCIDEVRRVTGKDLMRFGLDSLAGHYMFDAVNRANCPGPSWQREYRQRLFSDLMEEDDMYHRHDGWGLIGYSVGAGQTAAINARETFKVPAEAKRIDIEFLSETGYGVLLHGTSREQAGRFGWARRPDLVDGYGGPMTVELDPAGSFYLWAEDVERPPKLYNAHVVAWY